MQILVTGGAGYVGTVLTRRLLDAGHTVRVFDSLIYGVQPIVPLFHDKNFSLRKGDIRNASDVRSAAADCDAIVHLAAIVGYPACERDPAVAREVNVSGTRHIVEAAGKQRFVVFASTGSCYGAVREDLCTEDTPLNPLSVYGVTKAEAEDIVRSNCPSVVYRFATAFGVSPRQRLDLLINNFVYRAIREKRLEIYEPEAHRTFLHVDDLARSIVHALDRQSEMVGETYNVGDESQNLTKREMCELIRAVNPEITIDYNADGTDTDARDYIVGYKKIRDAGYRTAVPVIDGIRELSAAFEHWTESTMYGNA